VGWDCSYNESIHTLKSQNVAGWLHPAKAVCRAGVSTAADNRTIRLICADAVRHRSKQDPSDIPEHFPKEFKATP
jgi:hypothetical protein